MQKAVRVERIARLGLVESKLEALVSCQFRDMSSGGECLLTGNAVFGGQPIRRIPVALAWRLRIEFEAAPDNLNVVAVIETGERCFQTTFADVTPRTDDIGPNLNFHAAGNAHC